MVEEYPETGQPGQTYSATIIYEIGRTIIGVTRRVRVRETPPTIVIGYTIENMGFGPLQDFSFYQYMDYDIFGAGGDYGEYAPGPPEFIWQRDGGLYTGYTGSKPSAAHDIHGYFAVRDRILDGDGLLNRDSYRGDIGSAFKWGFGDLELGESVDLTLQFTFGRSLRDIKEALDALLFEDPVRTPSGPVGPPRNIDGGRPYEDVNSDGGLDRDDVEALQAIVNSHTQAGEAGLAPGERTDSLQRLTDEQQRALDFNNDGEFTEADVLTFANELGLVFDSPVQTPSGPVGPPANIDEDPRYEDIDGDGSITRQDLFQLFLIFISDRRAQQRGLAPGEEGDDVQALTPFEQLALDFNNDGVFDQNDINAFADRLGTSLDSGDLPDMQITVEEGNSPGSFSM